jgi:hypothetical protein
LSRENLPVKNSHNNSVPPGKENIKSETIRRTRSLCGKCNIGTFSSHVKPEVSYGVNLHAVVAYLSTVQNIPFKRLTGTLKDLYGIESYIDGKIYSNKFVK